MVNLLLIPTAEQIRELRKIFFEKLDNEGAPSTCVDGFHPKDIDRVQNVDVWLQRFLEQNDLDMKASLKQLWETCEWRRTYGTNDINESNINMDYVNVGDCFPRNHDIEGKMMLIYRSALHVKGKRDTKELIRIFVYWIERMYRKNNFEPITIFFDLANCGLKNLDMDYTINVVNILKSYYPNAANYILIYEMPWVFAAGIKIIKSLLPPKAVATMKFIDSKNITEYISYECMQRSWGGVDDYTFQFEPETVVTKQVHFANFSPPESPMGDQLGNNSFSDRTDGAMLQIKPSESIIFTNSGNELVGTVEIINIIQSPVTYKIKTTSPEKFRVRPSTGILAPGANAVINVVLQHGHQMPVLTKDKFLVMCMELASDASTTSHDIAELWKNMSTNSSQVEQHRLKCWTPSSVQSPGDSSKNGILYSNSLEGDHRSVSHFSSSTVTQQLVTATNRLESQMKFQQTLQWITLVVILLLSVAIVYILKMEIKNANGEYCTSMHRN